MSQIRIVEISTHSKMKAEVLIKYSMRREVSEVSFAKLWLQLLTKYVANKTSTEIHLEQHSINISIHN
jgi:hypothetical protein